MPKKKPSSRAGTSGGRTTPKGTRPPKQERRRSDTPPPTQPARARGGRIPVQPARSIRDPKQVNRRGGG